MKATGKLLVLESQVDESKMAEEVVGKSIEQLKKERTSAKISFTRQVNFLSREARRLVEEELKEEFKKLSLAARKVFEINDDYRTGLLAEIEADESKDEAVLSVQQDVDIERLQVSVMLNSMKFKKLSKEIFGQDMVCMK